MSNPSALTTSQPPVLCEVIDNPFIPLKYVSPVEWPWDIFQHVGAQDSRGSPILPRDAKPPEGFIPEESIEDSSYEEQDVYDLIKEFDEDPTNSAFFGSRIPDLLSRIVDWLQCAMGISHDVEETTAGSKVALGRQQWQLHTVAGSHIAGHDIYRYTDAIRRFTWREDYFLPRGVRWVERPNYPDQVDMDLDPLDLALLIGMAQRQKKRCVRANEYTAYVLYPSGTQKELFVLTATIPLQSLEAIERENEKMLPIRIQQAKVPLSVQKPLQQNALVKMLAALINHGVEMMRTVIREPRPASAT